TYLTEHTPPYPAYSSVFNSSFGANGGIYNKAGRGIPDVLALGDNLAIFHGGNMTTIGGISVSAPIWASIITRINAERLSIGKSTVGFINPTLYANPELMHDIVEGNNPGCGTNGFNASTGWDPVTGFGTPNYPALLNYFISSQ
ncbi:hypothetical protein N5P37_011466, partial [Trichoderma harzianum]